MLRILKRLVICLFILILTGCKATYKISIDENSIIEDTNIIENNISKFDRKNELLFNLTPREYLETYMKWPTPSYYGKEINPYEPIKLENTNYYDKKNISNYSKLGINYKYKFLNDEYKNSNIANTCFTYSYIKIDHLIRLETTSDFKCFDEYKILDELDVELDTKCKIINANNDYKNKWHFTKQNYKNKKILFELNCSPRKIDKSIESSINTLMILLVIVVLFGIISIIIIILRFENNKI